ncbi:DUF4082 domain-containing protein [Paenibacillus psychroresistens]|uniref:DUF4082 domain-containing protein n=1 Tax=Paenibacillus psychroresistens TaxID=1778678 RepID=A0A6B8RCS6_9BACL|nr:DUF4082 domain-containing protein [Paenibacillus psychroresistens]QGQ94271.1 DUF4082 domain-containing protein [Paenibacillus psychroresistens]
MKQTNGKKSRRLLALFLSIVIALSLFPLDLTHAAATQVNDNNGSITYSGAWTYDTTGATGYINSDQHYSNTNGNYAQYTFTGTSIKWIGPKNVDCGISQVYIDGALVATVDLYASSWLKQQVLYSNTSLSNASHTIKVVATNTKNAASISYYTSVDAFEYDTAVPITLNDTDSGIAYTGAWTYGAASGYVSGDQHYSSTNGNYAQLAFVGTSIKWIGPKNVDCGISQIYIDGVLTATVDLYASTWLKQQVLYSNTTLANTGHTIKVVITNTKNASSSGYYSSIDAFEYISTGAEKIFSDATTGTALSNSMQHELGQVFAVNVAGSITKVRLYAVSQETGNHTARIWRNSDGMKLGEYTIPAASFTGANGWITYTLPIPLSIASNTDYTVSVSTGTDAGRYWGGGTNASAGNNGLHISWPASSGRFTDTMGARPTTTPAGGESYLRDIEFIANAQVPTSLTVSGTDFIEKPSSLSRYGLYTAKVLDQNGDMIPNRTISWSLQTPKTGVSIDSGTGTVTVNSTAVNGTITVVATDAGSSMTGTKTVTIQSLTATAISVSGASALKIPATGSITQSYLAKVKDQQGNAMSGPTVTWSLQSPKTGVSINASSGVATVGSSATAGNFTIVATNGSISGTQLVSLDTYNTAVYLATSDTGLTLAVKNNLIYIKSLKNPVQGWDWINGDTTVPLVSTVSGVTPNWIYQDTTTDTTSGVKITLRFTSTTPNLELKSIWWARPGTGPVENWMTVQNNTGGTVSYGTSIQGTNIAIKADSTADLYRFSKTAYQMPTLDKFTMNASTSITTSSAYIPFGLLNVNGSHGFYVGYEWELGSFNIASGVDPLNISVSVNPFTETVTQANSAIFTIPSVYYGTYKGDIDDGGNSFKKWFWDFKVPRSLYNNPSEPWTEICFDPVGSTPQSTYDSIAASGVEAVKMDFGWYDGRNWTYRPAEWPNGFDFATKAHNAGLKASLYMGGTYNDADLNTIAGRDAELSALTTRYDNGWYDMWRTDIYTAPTNPMPDTYNGVTNFLSIVDNLITTKPGFRYENCANGGRYKGFAVTSRMTFITTNDEASDGGTAYRATLYVNGYAMNPIQLKSDVQIVNYPYAFMGRTSMLGSVLLCSVDTSNASYRQSIDLYKTKQRPILRGGNMYHILPMADGTNWDGMQFFNSSLNKGSVFLFKPSVNAADGNSKVIKLKGLDRNTSYTLTFQDRTGLNTVKSGAELMDLGISVTGMTGDYASEIIWIN